MKEERKKVEGEEKSEEKIREGSEGRLKRGKKWARGRKRW